MRLLETLARLTPRLCRLLDRLRRGLLRRHRAILAHRLRLTLFAHHPIAAVVPPIPIGTAILSAVWTTILTTIAITEALLITALEPTIVAMVAMMMILAMLTPVVSAIAIEAIAVLVARHLRLWLELLRMASAGIGILQKILRRLVVRLVVRTAFARLACMAIRALTMLRRELLAIGHDDAIVVLGVLQIVLGKHVVARRLRVARKSHVLLGNMSRSATDFHVRAVGLKAPRKRVLVLAVVVIVVVASATAAILLSLPHCVKGSRN